jgi:hypothetical protein
LRAARPNVSVRFGRAKIGIFSFSARLFSINFLAENIPETAVIGHANEYAVFPQFYRPVFKVITLSAYIPAVAYIEFIPVQGANHIAQRINKAIGQYTSGMGAFIGKGKNLFFIFPDTNLLFIEVS